MLIFLALCLLCRVAYTFNDVLIGELGRRHDPTEIAMLRGLSLGVTMAPLLLWVPPHSFAKLAARPFELSFLIAITAAGNVLHVQAARHLPFGLRAAVLVAGVALGGIALGGAFFGERFGRTELGWCALVVASGVLAALGDHSTDGLTANVPRGVVFTLASSAIFSVAAFLFARLSRATNPLLVGWVWEFGIGVLLLLQVLLLRRGRVEPGLARRFLGTGLRSLPTIAGTGASAIALTLGPLGVWAALAGTQALLGAALGAAWHREKLGRRRWIYFLLGAVGIAGLAFSRRD